eukprot:g63037.t1
MVPDTPRLCRTGIVDKKLNVASVATVKGAKSDNTAPTPAAAKENVGGRRHLLDYICVSSELAEEASFGVDEAMAQAEEIRTETGPLDYDYTEKEVELCQENLQNHKACSPDKIKNEMLNDKSRTALEELYEPFNRDFGKLWYGRDESPWSKEHPFVKDFARLL